jgi:hypothetical protein
LRRPSRTSAPASTVAVAGDVVGLLGDLLDELGADLLEGVLELDLLGDRDAVVRDRRRAPLLLEDDVATLRPERDLHRVDELVHTPLECTPGVLIELDQLRHLGCPPLVARVLRALALSSVEC